MSERGSPWALGCFSIIFTAVGIGIIFWGGKTLNKAKASLEWPGAEGTVIVSDVIRNTDSDGDVTYKPDVSYEYVIDGIKYSANRVAFGSWSSSDRSMAQRVVNHYPAGMTVTVRYDPDDPYEAVLEPGEKKGVWFLIAFGGVFAAVGLSLLFGGTWAMFKGMLK